MTSEEWEAKIPELRRLWAEGHSTAEIGRRLGVSKNSVVGKSQRLELPSRPSPIKPRAQEIIARPRRTPLAGATIPPLPSGYVPPPIEPALITAARPVTVSEPLEPPNPIFDEEDREFVPDQIKPSKALWAATVHRRTFAAEFRVPTPRPLPEPPRPRYGRVIECQWLEGSGPFTACPNPSEPSRSFCEAHCKQVYVNYRRTQDAAD